MTERPKWHQGAVEASKRFERFWQIFDRPGEHRPEELEWAKDFMASQIENYMVAIGLGGIDELSVEVLNRVFQGVYHKNIEPPAEPKYHPNSI